jgi:hypothetical protein
MDIAHSDTLPPYYSTILPFYHSDARTIDRLKAWTLGHMDTRTPDTRILGTHPLLGE